MGFVAEMLNFLDERDSHTSLQRAKEGRGSGCDLNVSERQRWKLSARKMEFRRHF